MKTRRVSWLVCLLVSLAFTIFYLPIRVLATEAETEAALVEGAKKEGKLVIYHSTNVESYMHRINAFKKKYPFIAVENWRDNGTKILIRVLAEANAKRYFADVIDVRGFEINILKEKGLLMKYSSPNFRFIAPEFIDPDGYYGANCYSVQSVSYNTKLISPKETPETWNDLLNPRWKGKMGMDFNDYEWYANMLTFMGKEKGLEFMKKLSKQDIQFRSGKRLLATLLVAGELHLFLTSSGHTIESLRKQGAPVEWVPFNPVMAMVNSMGITSHTSHPNAVKLYVNFISSQEGQNMISRTSGMNPVRAEAKYLYPNLDVRGRGYKLIFSSITTDYYTKFDKEFRAMFMAK